MKTLEPGTFLVQLGRAGDILNILPMLERAGGGWVVCNPEFMSVLESFSCVRGIPFAGCLDDYQGAAKTVANAGKPVLVTQRFGHPDFAAKPLSDSYAKDEWLAAGIEPTLENGYGTLNPDVRFESEERALLSQYRKTNKPLMLVNTLGFSSAYPHRERLRRHLASWDDRFEIVDLSGIITPHLCSLVALYEQASVLITTDTATLHLAPAVPRMPVIRLHPKGWYASPAKGNVILSQPYADTNFAAIDAQLNDMAKVGTVSRRPNQELEIWYAIPTANPQLCTETFAAWQQQGYKTAALVDGDTPAPGNADMVVRVAKYQGYAKSVNLLAHSLRDADIVVTGGDDILPDMSQTARQIGNLFVEHFNGTYGVMQPTGDKWGNIQLYAGSPWMGREFIDRSYGGKGPFWGDYFHYGCDTELQGVAKLLGCFWQNPAITQVHNQYQRTKAQMPAYLRKATQLQPLAQQMHDRRQRARFPGHASLPAGNPAAALERVAFTIVLNGSHHLLHKGFADKMAAMFDRWVIVEGAAANNGSTAWCRQMPEQYHRDGHSIDATLRNLSDLQAAYPNITLVTRKGLWPSKDEQVRAALAEIRHPRCFLWQVDVDEQWTRQDLEQAEQALRASGQRIGMVQFDHYVGQDLVAVGEWGSDWIARVWDWQGEPAVSHEPPVFRGVAGEIRIPVKFKHYSYCFPQDVQFKQDWYGYQDIYANWVMLQRRQEFPCPISALFGDRGPGRTNTTIVRAG